MEEEVLFDLVEEAHIAGRLAAVHLEPRDNFCSRLLFQLDGSFIDLAEAYRGMHDLSEAMWDSYLGKTWEDFDLHSKALAIRKEEVFDLTNQLRNQERQGIGRCWPR